MRKLLIAAVATGIVGAVALKPVPANALIWIPAVLEAKKDKNFKAVNPYAPVKVKKAKAKKKM
jgi:hypothetical protein